jgi:prepilin-type N-terminal cleavage/methylation domain-containing protein
VEKFSAQSGFTLIEVVITIFLVVLMLVFFQVAASTMRLATIAQQKERVSRVIGQKIETLRAAGYDGVGSSGTFTDPQLNNLQNVSASTTISDYNAEIKQVTVGVSWLGAGSTTRYLGATTLLVNSGGL